MENRFSCHDETFRIDGITSVNLPCSSLLQWGVVSGLLFPAPLIYYIFSFNTSTAEPFITSMQQRYQQ